MDDMAFKDEQHAAAQARVRRLSKLGDDLLAQTDGADAMTAEALRSEATRLFGLCHEITATLVRCDVPAARCLSIGDADEDGTVLGVAV